MPFQDAVARLEELKRRFSPQDAAEVERLLAFLEKLPSRDAASLIRFHEALLFLCAYPHNQRVLSLARKLLAAFTERVNSLRADGAGLEPFDAPEVSGIAGSVLSAHLSYDIASRLARRYPARVDIDWDNYEISDRLAPLWRRVFPLVEDDSMVEAHVPYLEWLRSAMGRKGSTLAWLADRIDRLPLPAKDRADLFDALELPVRWDLATSPASRTLMRRPVPRAFYHDGPLLKRGDVSLAAELTGPPAPVERLTHVQGERILNMAREASAVRYRELHGFTYGDPRRVLKAVLGRGVEVFVAGVPPDRRLPLRACHSALILKNGVPLGYFEALTLFERVEAGFNLYYTFREGETAWLFVKLLRLLHQLLGVRCFSIDPYQIGYKNQEAIDSGAFWFYRKLGFRPVLPQAARLADAEEAKISRDPSYRTPAGILRRLAVGHMVYEMPGTAPGDWDRFNIRKVGLAVQRRLGGRPFHSNDLRLVLEEIPEFGRWTKAEKALASEIVRAKTAPDEVRYVRLLQRHSRLRQAIIRIGS